MYKNKQFKKLEKKYSEYQDSGSVGFFMNICHKNLEVDIKNDAIEKKKKKKNFRNRSRYISAHKLFK